MPLPLETIPQNIVPNTYRYDLSIATRISDGRLKVSIGTALHPCNCTDEIWSDCFAETQGHMIPDLDDFVIQNPELAELVTTTYANLNILIAAINGKTKLV